MAQGEGLISCEKRKAGMFTDFGTIGEAKDCIMEGMQDFRDKEAVYRRGCGTVGDSQNLRTILGWGIAHGGIEGKIAERQWK